MALSGFNIDACAPTPPGAGVIEYVPIDEVDASAWPSAIKQSTYNQQSPAGVATWYALPAVQGTGAWTEDQAENDNGIYYRNNIQATLPSDSSATRAELNRMRNHRFLVRLTKNGTSVIIGTITQPLKFESRFESGAEGSDSRTHRCVFSGPSLSKSPNYIPTF